MRVPASQPVVNKALEQQNLLEAEKWAKQNVNMRAILEYLMLVMPSKVKVVLTTLEQ